MKNLRKYLFLSLFRFVVFYCADLPEQAVAAVSVVTKQTVLVVTVDVVVDEDI